MRLNVDDSDCIKHFPALRYAASCSVKVLMTVAHAGRHRTDRIANRSSE